MAASSSGVIRPAAAILIDGEEMKDSMPRAESTVDQVLAQAVALYGDGDIAGSADLFRVVLELDPSNAVANHQLGLIAFAQGNAVAAAEHLRQDVSADPTELEYQNNLGVTTRPAADGQFRPLSKR